ncbi:hypothetical protein FH972_025680 [Carpinus fangiana]|uniref:rRNA 2'-O-methyltransferase fibrillarin n=1 Tax=Carpinus fangiana TaxID=176857 RepID=A0A5N6L241_9ROSI|nr:hypothetical protein FH972_025680 [Carpinus fangiana]
MGFTPRGRGGFGGDRGGRGGGRGGFGGRGGARGMLASAHTIPGEVEQKLTNPSGGFGDRGGRGGGRGGAPRGRGGPRGGRGGIDKRGGRGGGRGGLGARGGQKHVLEPHRHAGIFVARGKEDLLVTKNLTPGETVYGEKKVVIDNPATTADGEATKTEYRVWNPFRSKLAAAVLGGVENTYMGPGSKVLYLGAASGTSVSHGGGVLVSVKANCIDSTKPPEQVFAMEVQKMRAEKIKPKEQMTLEPFERDHCIVAGLYKPDATLLRLQLKQLSSSDVSALFSKAVFLKRGCGAQQPIRSGLDNAGKTTIVKRIMNEDVNSVSPTLGFIIKTIDFDGCAWLVSALLSLQLTGDVGGQKTLRTYWKNYFEKTDTLIWVVDATDRQRMKDCRDELAGLLLEERLQGASLLVLKNKSDVPGSMDEHDIRQGLGLDAIISHKWVIMACSAITGENLQQGLEWVVQDAKDRLFLY